MHTNLCPGVDYVGCVDWITRDFHGYTTSRGTSYNAYLVQDEKCALIDTVKAPFAEQLLANISEVIDLDQIDYVVMNHAETDHAGGIARVMEACPQARIVCNRRCHEALLLHNRGAKWDFEVIQDDDTLFLGRRTLRFIDTPMVHWPESMATYLPEEQILFSMDTFGQHYASSGRFEESEAMDILMEETRIYYANIFMGYANMVAKALQRVRELDLKMIAPSHGIIWQGSIDEILDAYDFWSQGKCAEKVVVIFDTMWGSTEKMSRAIVDGAEGTGVLTRLHSVHTTPLSILAAEACDAAAVAFGSSTLNRGMLPTMAAVLHYLHGLRPRHKAGLAFGSFGWSKGAETQMTEALEKMEFEILAEPVLAHYIPSEEDLEACREAGRILAEAAMRKAGKA